MSKYKVGDKVILTVTGMTEMGNYPHYVLNDNFYVLKQSIDEYAEPLSTYTEPLERKNENKQKQIEKLVDKLHRQAADITRLLRENAELKEESKRSYIINNEMARAEGHSEAWELARKIFDMETNDIEDIFITEDAWNLGTVLNNYTYSEAAAKVAEWEKAKEEIKVGDIYRSETGNYVAIRTTDGEKGVAKILFMSNGEVTPDYIKSHCTKTGRHIDIDSFLKQKGGAE